jgi:hypothetical protein
VVSVQIMRDSCASQMLVLPCLKQHCMNSAQQLSRA